MNNILNNRYSAKQWWTLAAVTYFVLGYYASAWLGERIGWQLDPAMTWDAKIPFIPGAIFGYLVVYLSLACAYWQFDDPQQFSHFVRGIFPLLTLHFLIFIFFPAVMRRPEPAGDGLIIQITQWYFAIDPPRNVFPSLHVGEPLYITISIWSYKPRWGWIFLLMTLITAISVLLIKQHYIADVLAAFLFTGSYSWWWNRRKPHPGPLASAG